MFGTLSVVFTDDRTAPVGAYALNEAGVPVGVLREVSSGTGIVDLLSASHVETEVHIGTAIATMTGAGSTTLIARVPQGAHVKAGDAVIMTALGEPLGVVSSTQSTPADAEVTVYIQPSAQPTNIQFLTFVGASKK
jgi:cell shape-determining protein MreC